MFVEPGFLPLIKSLLRENAEQKPQPPPKLDRNHRTCNKSQRRRRATIGSNSLWTWCMDTGTGAAGATLSPIRLTKPPGNAAYDDRPTELAGTTPPAQQN